MARASRRFVLAAAALAAGVLPLPVSASEAGAAGAPVGYYRMPAIHGDVVVFSAEGDLWTVAATGGVARRLTSHPGEEAWPAISPDGATLAFTADYEGPTELYTMPVAGGLPRRQTWDGGVRVVGWTPDGRVLYASRHRSTLPAEQLFALDPATSATEPMPLSEAADGCIASDGATLVFTRNAAIGSHTRHYRGGALRALWRFAPGDAEARPLIADHPGNDFSPMCLGGRVYFLSDREGGVDLWSVAEDGSGLTRHTTRTDFDIREAATDGHRIVYRLGADLYLLDPATAADRVLDVSLATDLDQLRVRWIEKPTDWLTSFALSPAGDRLALIARGRLFVVPAGAGRLVEASRQEASRLRAASFLPDGKGVLALSDASGEVEIWRFPADGVGAARQLTHDGTILRWQAVASPDGKWVAHTDKNQRLLLLDVATGAGRQIASSPTGDIDQLAWSPDSRFLAFARPVDNGFSRIEIYEVAAGRTFEVTSDRWDSGSPAWSRDGKFLYFLSDRDLRTWVPSVWGNRQPDPFSPTPTRVYGVALTRGARWPFQPADELAPSSEPEDDSAGEPGKGAATATKAAKPAAPEVEIDAEGLASRLFEVPVPSGRYDGLAAGAKHLFLLATALDFERTKSLVAIPIDAKDHEPATVLAGVEDFRLSADGKKLAVRQKDDFFVFDAGAKAPSPLADSRVDLSGWRFPLDPREEFRQMYVEAWRLLRDYYWDPGMRGLDWPAMLEKYRPLAARVTSREELSDVLAQLTSELATLHHFVFGGDFREGRDDVGLASLGAVLERDEKAGGFRVARVYHADPEVPDEASPLDRPASRVAEGETILAVDGVPALAARDAGELLRGKSGQQVLLRVRGASGAERDIVAQPIDSRSAFRLRYRDWTRSRREMTEKLGGGRIGYLHLSAMSGPNWEEFARQFYPVDQRQGLVVDVRHNTGGNIDSWILSKLMRRSWAFWKPRVGRSTWNMQQAFRGPMILIADQWTFSDGELFSEGFRRLGLGPVLGVRTEGGEIWLSFSNLLVDRGIASAAEYGVYGPEGAWLIENHGVEPDITVDDPPHATFEGDDAQLDAAVAWLLRQIDAAPSPVPAAPPYPGPPHD
jgi:tricorn protease